MGEHGGVFRLLTAQSCARRRGWVNLRAGGAYIAPHKALR
jgi:hypothetical protein